MRQAVFDYPATQRDTPPEMETRMKIIVLCGLYALSLCGLLAMPLSVIAETDSGQNRWEIGGGAYLWFAGLKRRT
jgi:hypothetical protein